MFSTTIYSVITIRCSLWLSRNSRCCYVIHAVLKHSLKALSRRVTWHCRRLLQECHDDIVEVSIVKSRQTMLVVQVCQASEHLILVDILQIKEIFILTKNHTIFTCTSTSCFPTAFIKKENRDKSTPLGNIVASARRIAADMQPSITAKTFWSCILRIHRQTNSARSYRLRLELVFMQE